MKLILLLIVGMTLSLGMASAALVDQISLYYPFNDARDAVAGIFNLTNLQGSPTFQTAGALIGLSGNISVDNNWKIINNANTDLVMRKNNTLNFWVYQTSRLNDLRLMVNNGTGQLWKIEYLNTTNNITLDDLVNPPQMQTLTLDTWHMITIVANATNVSLYFDGVGVGTSRYGTANGSGDILLGTNNGLTNDWAGLMDELGFWNRTLTGAEITQLYNGGAGVALFGSGNISTSLLFPNDNQVFSSSEIDFNASSSTLNDLRLRNATLFIWNSSNANLYNVTQLITGTSNVTNWSVFNISFGTYKWNVLSCGNATGRTECAFSANNRTFVRQQIQVDAQLFNATVYDTSSSYFEINVTLDAQVTFFSASLNYSGRSYIADSVTEISPGSFKINKTIDIPPVGVNTTRFFNWIINVELSGSFTSVVTPNGTQLVAYTNITNLETTYPVSLNYSLFDEETLLPILGFFDGTHIWHLGNGSEIRNNSFDLGGPNRSFSFYSPPIDNNFFVDSEIAMTINESYNNRNFDFREQQINSTSKNQSLLFLRTTNGTEFIVTAKDTGLNPLPNYLIKIYRYYPGTNTFRMVESRSTDVFGQITARVVENSVKYRIEFYDEQNNLVKTENNVFFTCRNAVCIAEFVVGRETNLFEQFSNLTNYEANLVFNNNTNTFVFTWNDNRNQDSSHRLYVVRYLFNGTTTICDNSSTSSLGILSCAVGDQRASYQAQAFRTVNGNERRIDSEGAKVGSSALNFGREGLIWSFIITMTMIALGVYWPPAGIVLYLFANLFLGLLDIVFIEPAFLIGQLVIGGLFIWAFRG